MCKVIKMYSQEYKKDMYWVDDGEVSYHGPYHYKAEAQEKADELNGGE